jgi:hypothetical protein
MHNIEKSPFRKGEYVGYACGVWNIRPVKVRVGKWRARWVAVSRDDKSTAPLYAERLSDLSVMLAEYEKEKTAPVA